MRIYQFFARSCLRKDVFEQPAPMQRELGIDTRMLAPAELASRYPWLDTEGVAGGAFEPEGGYADPEAATNAFAAAASAAT